MSAADVASLAATGAAADGAVVAALLHAATISEMAARETMTRDPILCTDYLLLRML
jgi:hypothetical protein